MDRNQLIRFLLSSAKSPASDEFAVMSTDDLRRRYVRTKALALKSLNDRARFALEEAVAV